MQKLQYSDTPKFHAALREFCGRATVSGDVSGVVASVLADIRKDGDAAVLRYTEKFDGAKLNAPAMRVDPAELKAAEKTLSAADRKAIRESIAMVKEFHKKTLPKAWKAKNAQGGVIGERFYPIQRVGLYIPGGNVPLVSTVVMTAVLAKLVKCPEIAVCTPPAADGSIAPGMLAALSMVGIEEVYKVGGVQAIGAMAFGTKTIPAVDKIFGPGNAFVMEAKRQVLGTVGIDLLPGPSEVMIIADSGANPNHVAADLLAQAEHGSGKEIIYFATTSKALIGKVEKAIAKQMPALSHAEKCAKVIDGRCLAVHCKTLDQCVAVANYVAPEHLELQVADKSIEPLSQQITTAGAILQGYLTPTVLGDFTAGPSHTLPTGRAGRFFSGLQASDFMRRSSIVRYDAKSLAQAAPVVETFARLEKLDAHGKSLTIRL
ncbi:histidinol dehydrogenase [Coraliomargarita parva]|uniref:histidinol dehydrogenase n=1 Tax=Coraliomargarita parva TaxID=3014050 RepID=UPI0022B40303|nr:histidinol dehydrogenase [Coraliomargarita parva]